jgi:hypothetical protein
MKEIGRSYVAPAKSDGFVKRQFPRLKTLALIIIAGIVLGTQIYNPNKRTIEAIAGLVLLVLLWRFSTITALWMLLITYLFPFAISWGTSNEIFMLIIGMFVLLRISTGEHKLTIDRKIRLPLILIAVSYFISFKNVTPALMHLSLVSTFNFLAAAGFMVLIINFVDDEVKLKKTIHIMMISAALFVAFTIFEMLFPGKTFIPNWLYTHHKARLVMRGVRMGGPFHDYELAAEFFTLNAFFIFFVLIRSKRLVVRSLLGLFLVTDLFMMFTTITRGAFFSLIVGTVYLIFLSRKDISFVRFSYIVVGMTVLLVVLEGIVARYTTSGSLFERVMTTTFESGLVPSNRVGTWENAIERGMKNPVFGRGAGWDFARGLTTGYWPHCLYLYYFNITGLFGLSAFIFLVYRLLKATFAGVRASLVTSSYPEALLKIMHVVLIIFLFDQIKIEYLRNGKYTYFIWFFFGMIIATHNIVTKQRRERAAAEAAVEHADVDMVT